MLRRKRKWDKSILLLIFIAVIVVGIGVFAYLQLRTDLFSETVREGEPLAVLFAVSGDRDYRFFEILLYHPRTHRGAVIYIPGNVGLLIESVNKMDRIDVLYHKGELSPLIRKLEELTGLKIPFWVDLPEARVSALVDLLGGLELFIPNPVEMVSRERSVLLPSGSVLLDGDKVRDFISYQDPGESDMDQAGRRQKFLQALLKRMGESDILSSRQGMEALRAIAASNLGSRALLSFVAEMKKLEVDTLVFQRVLGSTRVVDEKELLFPHFEGQLLKEIVRQTEQTIASQQPSSEGELTLSLEVLNGTTVTGLARRAASVFQSFGYDIVVIGNTETSDYEKTAVLDRKGRIEAAQQVAELIRCERVYSRPEEGVDTSVDVTVILGKDFDGRYCKD
jgi:anionic cell wall polymer biosynthesis LytR-Cps2A-Psr (LCP) family protein